MKGLVSNNDDFNTYMNHSDFQTEMFSNHMQFMLELCHQSAS